MRNSQLHCMLCDKEITEQSSLFCHVDVCSYTVKSKLLNAAKNGSHKGPALVGTSHAEMFN